MKYKILNNTFNLKKRDSNYKKDLYFEYIDGFDMKKVTIKPSQLVYMEFNSLPISLRKLMLKGLVSVLQVTDDEYYSELNKHNKILLKNKIKNKENLKEKNVRQTTKKYTKKNNKSTNKSTSKQTTKIDDESIKKDE